MSERSIAEIQDAVGRLHSAAWHGRNITPGDKPRFSIPRQPTDDDEIAYAAIKELEQLRGERSAIVAWLRAEAKKASGSGPVDRDVVATAIAQWIEDRAWESES